MSTIPETRPTRERTPAPVQRPNEIGVTTTRVDGIPKVKGEFEYSSDMNVEGMLFGATLRSPHPRADIWGIDISKALALGTIDGARCLGRDDELGSLEPGKLADVALWRLDDLGHAGIEDPVAALVLGAPPRVEALLVGGRPVVQGGELRTADEDALARELAAASRKLHAIEVAP